MATNKIQSGFRFDEETLKKISYIAKRNKRSLNGQVEFLVQQCIETYEEENGPIILQKSNL